MHCAYCAGTNQMYSTGTVSLPLTENGKLVYHALSSRNVFAVVMPLRNSCMIGIAGLSSIQKSEMQNILK